ncbi:UDP-Glycosyltransferase superfamily protein [Actinidia rufa]|uniref:UDP-Glycosyltransferase superfamily protein n=1 Tax=Actinidia rufa TaxID=165716 RepID=A0A7J0E2S5_9ERIC|nr:UDP-Glycosyltransferase superfamily protein [Actinidia rufa]
MELAFLLRGIGAEVVWVTNQKPTELDEVVYSLEHKMLDRGVQAQGECFGRITIEAMAFQLPVLGTAAGGTMEIVVNGMNGSLHPAGKEGVTPLSENIVKFTTHVEQKLTMEKKGYERVKEIFLEAHMSHGIASVLKEVLRKSNSNT